jgi:acyl-CoA reductase-like NAD-dependent aldehyde dehydrogenase
VRYTLIFKVLAMVYNYRIIIRKIGIFMNISYPMVIGSELVDSEDTFPVIDPATEKEIANAPNATKAHVDSAVKCASIAFETWGQSSQKAFRKAKLLECQQALYSHADEIATLLTQEQGKPLSAARGEVKSAIAEISTTVNYPLFHKVLQDDEHKKVEMEQIPFGVVAAICPWNYPVYIALTKMVAALWSGNTMVMKPSEYTPLTTLKIAAIIKEVLPSGVFNVICGKGDVGAMLVAHPKVSKISFTGSVPTGKKIAHACAEDLKRMTLELGGNDAAIILENTPIEPFLKKVFWGAFVNSGQICVAIKRLFIHTSQVEAWAKALAQMAADTIVGNGMDESTQIGPINNKMQYEKVKNYFESAKSSGATVWGEGPVEGEGYFFKPTIVTNIHQGHPLVDEEQFGPLLPIIAYDDIEQAIASANELDIGLAGSVWGQDEATVNKIANKMHTGTVWINTIHDTHQDACFGGVKHSGIGREGGIEGLKSFGEIKVIARHNLTK